jgi:prevent-host-death family protein
MQTLTIGELKGRFSEILKKVRSGQEIVISHGKAREKIAVIVPYSNYVSRPKRSLGLLKDRAKCIIHEDFGISEEEMLTS